VVVVVVVGAVTVVVTVVGTEEVVVNVEVRVVVVVRMTFPQSVLVDVEPKLTAVAVSVTVVVGERRTVSIRVTVTNSVWAQDSTIVVAPGSLTVVVTITVCASSFGFVELMFAGEVVCPYQVEVTCPDPIVFEVVVPLLEAFGVSTLPNMYPPTPNATTAVATAKIMTGFIT
jgi:hypothetical protein